MCNRIIGIATRDLKAGQICILGKDIITRGMGKVLVEDTFGKSSLEPCYIQYPFITIGEEGRELTIKVDPKERN